MSTDALAILVVVGLLAIALAVGGNAISTRTTSEPVAVPKVGESATVVPREVGLIKNGLQPRPFSMIAAPPEVVVTDAPDGFIRVGTDFRPMPIAQRP
jgi:hypothetical protein